MTGALSRTGPVLLAFALASGAPAWAGTEAATAGDFDLVGQIRAMVPVETWRAPDGSNEQQVQDNIGRTRALMQGWIDGFVAGRQLVRTAPVAFEWRKPGTNFWVFGWRAGQGPRKVAILTHLDTVPPGDTSWGPFSPREEDRIYKGSVTRFVVGRGAIDDKGPAAAALDTLLSVLASVESDPSALDAVTLEVLVDTSEEGDSSTAEFYRDRPEEKPAFGIVLDGSWCVRAEKGVERPLFSVPVVESPKDGLWIRDFLTPPGPVNQIPGFAQARITGASATALDAFAAEVARWYREYRFDDPAYASAGLRVSREGADVVLTTLVAGAQHGSAPELNRRNGANPLVSLANFLASLRGAGVLGDNHFSRMATFIQWGWGTTVFGEKHPDLLAREDTVFGPGNGTTYALTQLSTDEGRARVVLGVDIRYALGHHAAGWDGSEGQLPGASVLASSLGQLVERYAHSPGGSAVAVETRTAEAPDIRDPGDERLRRVDLAYRDVMGAGCPMMAAGGGTDAKGQLNLVTTGPLFTNDWGPPINYHGIDEGAPLIDLENSGRILRRILEGELRR